MMQNTTISEAWPTSDHTQLLQTEMWWYKHSPYLQCSCKSSLSESNAEDSCRTIIGGQAECFLLDISALFILVFFFATIEKFHVYSKRIYDLNVSNCTMYSYVLSYWGKNHTDIHQVSFNVHFFIGRLGR